MALCPSCLSASLKVIEEEADGYAMECLICGDTWLDEYEDYEDEPYPDSDRQHVNITTKDGNKAFATLSKDASPDDIKLVENIVDEIVKRLNDKDLPS